MSYDDSDDGDGEWEVVDIVHTTTSVKPDKKHKTAKKEDVDKLAAEIQAQLSLKHTQDTQSILLLEQKLQQQQRMSEHQLQTLQSKLDQITKLQKAQERQQRDIDKQRKELEQHQKQQLLEQQIQIQSLSDNQMLTQKQLLEAHQQIQQTQQVTQNVNENLSNLQQLQHQQAIQHQMTEQQMQQQQQELHQQIQQQQQLNQLAQIAQQTQQQQQLLNAQLPSFLPPPPTTNNNHNNHNINNVNNNHNNNNNDKNSWLPSFFVFGNNKNGNSNKNNNNNVNMNGNLSNTSVQDMELGSSPPLQPLANMMIPQQIQNPEEKSNILIDDDDDDVLQWQNDYGRDHNPLYQNPELLKTKGMIGEGKFVPNEKRQCGWILQNKSNVYLKLQAKLQCIGGDKEQHGMRISTEKLYEFSLKPNEEVYILIEVSAPSMPGKYCAFYQLVIDNQVKIGEMLEIMCEVQSQFSDKKEQKIAQIIKMGFDDRKKVIATLQKNKWNVQQSIDKLIGL